MIPKLWIYESQAQLLIFGAMLTNKEPSIIEMATTQANRGGVGWVYSSLAYFECFWDFEKPVLLLQYVHLLKASQVCSQ